jgi:predicted GIY-YIG superfamily endonuclease
MNKTNIYILRLEHGKYYVGKSNNVLKRYHEHASGSGSTWTAKYKPIEFVQVIENVSPFDEDKWVKEYMAKYGIDNVRGGAYANELLDDVQHLVLQKEIWAAKDRCTQCGRKGHFEKDCYAVTDIYGNPIGVWSCHVCNQEFNNPDTCEKHERACKQNQIECYRCGYKGHYANACYAKRHVDGRIL